MTCGLLTWYGTLATWDNYSKNAYDFFKLPNFPIFYVYLIIPIGSLLWLIQLLRKQSRPGSAREDGRQRRGHLRAGHGVVHRVLIADGELLCSRPARRSRRLRLLRHQRHLPRLLHGGRGLRAIDRQRLWQPVGFRPAADHDVHPAGRNPVSDGPRHQDDRRARQLAGLGTRPPGAAGCRFRHHPGFAVGRQHRHHGDADADLGAGHAGARLQQEDERRAAARQRRSRGDDAAQRAWRYPGGDRRRIRRQAADRHHHPGLPSRALLRDLHRRRLRHRSERGAEIHREKDPAERTLGSDDQICRSAYGAHCRDDRGDLSSASRRRPRPLRSAPSHRLRWRRSTAG